MQKKAIIIGAGPAGLTAAYELVCRTDIHPIILEKSDDIGGLCKTVNYRGNRLDIGGHRFFSKSERVMKWWLNILPLDQKIDRKINIQYHQQSQTLDPSKYPLNSDALNEKAMLIRSRLSRIFYLDTFFNYPLSISIDTIRKLGAKKLFKVGVSYIRAKIWPRKEKNLEDFFINRFGNVLYSAFFKDYTEKVWGMPCNQISADWGAQRVKELSVGKAVIHSIKKGLRSEKARNIQQKNKHTSLIEYFLYPKYGPGQLWEEVARIIKEKGGEIYFGREVSKIIHADNTVTKVEIVNKQTQTIESYEGNFLFSSMPVSEFVAGMYPAPPIIVTTVARGLQYRDFITVGLLVRKLKITDNNANKNDQIKDNWIYIQDRTVKLGRLQIYNNWSPFMVRDPETIWLGLEYFCNVGDELWLKPDEEFIQFATSELVKIGFIDLDDVLDGTIIRMEKTYPAYFGTYSDFDIIKNYFDRFINLFPVGRNGMHRYNITDKENIWKINTEQEYAEG
jgi:protoporphyrinogen oxidase